MMETQHVFISYSRRDGNDMAAKIETELKKRRFHVWRDIRNLNPTQDFTADIENGIEAASSVIVCITPDTKRSDSFVRREIQYALTIKKPLIPLRFADVTPHVSIINNEWIDYFQDPSIALDRLIQILGHLNDTTKISYGADKTHYPIADDPFRLYLQELYTKVINYLKKTIIREQLIQLTAKNTPQMVLEHSRSTLNLDFMPYSSTESQSTSPNFVSFSEAFAYYDKRMLLLGKPGSGKTITLMAYLRDAIAAYLDNPILPIPLYGVIATWDAEKHVVTPANWTLQLFTV